jgi:hypothetical protein
MTTTQQEIQAALIQELTQFRREYVAKLIEARDFCGRSGQAKDLIREIEAMKELIQETEEAIVILARM